MRQALQLTRRGTHEASSDTLDSDDSHGMHDGQLDQTPYYSSHSGVTLTGYDEAVRRGGDVITTLRGIRS